MKNLTKLKSSKTLSKSEQKYINGGGKRLPVCICIGGLVMVNPITGDCWCVYD